ncbi:MAG TPA: undecaprenyldiphospho-muramoylpentapeptide beta-N-acetylglucosaminyltransferase [Thermoanaerobaculales bacterium]|nr:undecaprenyldiphospho-muramoylpentapeptide beta-N-acetylglucosaminyltransferase [Thermoanaerobaculales bacterium]HQN96876.1 undecaprenyldiphospho-muramoylpentapeptide beta-N-acetylglucosaminyltransferase [Thermoanaerobaculales bacterium]HQP45144.1 undecaprenyldiphospho-muramoylpentapeptide beta-N-acetylglucosaminyltransferase [Thermoanaerobaculales bacterium]
MSRPVVVAGGGTGGHIFPGLAVARELQALGARAHWLGARKGLEAELVGQRGVPLTLVDLEGFHGRGAVAVLRALGLMPGAVATSIRTMLEIEPSAVLGVGGYASGAGLMAAGLLGIPYVLQEQNSIPGLTNRFLSPWSALVCCGFADAVRAFPSLPAEWTGNPVRESFFKVPPVEPATPPRLLVLGGSQGSLFLNRTLPRAVAILRGRGITPQVRHQAGVRWADVVRTSYQDLAIGAEVAAFLSEPWTALAEADLVVARSGALTVSELAAAGRGAVLIPFAAAAGGHQLHNARSQEKAGGAVVLTEAEASPERVADVLQELLADPGRLRAMGSCSRAVSLPDAARRIAERVLAVGSGR